MIMNKTEQSTPERPTTSSSPEPQTGQQRGTGPRKPNTERK